jgi:hypothetical protein
LFQLMFRANSSEQKFAVRWSVSASLRSRIGLCTGRIPRSANKSRSTRFTMSSMFVTVGSIT